MLSNAPQRASAIFNSDVSNTDSRQSSRRGLEGEQVPWLDTVLIHPDIREIRKLSNCYG